MKKLFSLAALAALLSAGACKKEEKKNEAPKAEEKATTPPVEADTNPHPVEADPPGDAPEMANKMKHCPSSVGGAETVVSDGEGVVIVTVTSKVEADHAEIRKRATHLAGLSAADASKIEHSGTGTGGGALGKCPVIVGQAKVSTEDIDGGAKITMTPNKEGGLEALSTLAKERLVAMEAGATNHAHDHGSGKGGGKHKGDGSGGGERQAGDHKGGGNGLHKGDAKGGADGSGDAVGGGDGKGAGTGGGKGGGGGTGGGGGGGTR